MENDFSDSESEEEIDAAIRNHPNYSFFQNYGWGLTDDEAEVESPIQLAREIVSVATQIDAMLSRCVYATTWHRRQHGIYFYLLYYLQNYLLE